MEHKTQKPMNRLEEIRQREEKAAPGPWMEKETDGYAEIHNTDTWGKQFQPIALVAYKENADFIAHAREDIPWLLERIGQLEEQFAAAVTVKGLDDWHEDIGDVLWWKLPVCEPPYCGSPLDSDWPGYHTHWTELLAPECHTSETEDAT